MTGCFFAAKSNFDRFRATCRSNEYEHFRATEKNRKPKSSKNSLIGHLSTYSLAVTDTTDTEEMNECG